MCKLIAVFIELRLFAINVCLMHLGGFQWGNGLFRHLQFSKIVKSQFGSTRVLWSDSGYFFPDSAFFWPDSDFLTRFRISLSDLQSFWADSGSFESIQVLRPGSGSFLARFKVFLNRFKDIDPIQGLFWLDSTFWPDSGFLLQFTVILAQCF